MEGNESGFRVEMTLTCAGDDHAECYQIEALSCGGQEQTLSMPILLDGCAGAAYCVDACGEGASGGDGNLWDIPELLEIDACDTYAQQ